MLKDTGKKLEEKDRKDLGLCFQTLNTAFRMLDSTPGLELLEDDHARDYLAGICDVLLDARVSLHLLRKEISKKYDVPYSFMIEGNSIYIED